MNKAYETIGVGETPMRHRIEQLKSQQQGITPSTKALEPQLLRSQEQDKRIKRLELGEEILKTLSFS